MNRLLAAHERHLAMPFHVLALEGRMIGVTPSAVATIYGTFLRHLEDELGGHLTDTALDAMIGSRDLGDGFARLRRLVSPITGVSPGLITEIPQV
jgi:hypothetical protein